MALSATEKIKQNQIELEVKLRETLKNAESRSNEIEDILDISRQHIAEQEGRISSVLSAMDNIHNDADSRREEIFSHIDAQAKGLESGIREVEKQIEDFIEQAKLVDKTGELKQEMEKGIEALRADLKRLEQARAEAAKLETHFIKVKKLEDEVNAKMTRFLNDKHQIEQMDTEFNRLIQTSKAVEDKLKELNSSNDLLQHLELQIRKMGETLGEVEEKYQRIEKKNQVLETTNDGIDKNFKSLQKSEKTLKKVDTDLDRVSEDISSLKKSIEYLAGQNEKAHETVDQMTLLNTTLSDIEERIAAMEKAREWIARAETRMEELNREILENIKLQGTVQQKGRKKASAYTYDDTPSPSMNVKENVIKLAKQKYTVEQIAKTVGLSRSEVELILDMYSKE
jgi:chromosome segregation ATPase